MKKILLTIVPAITILLALSIYISNQVEEGEILIGSTLPLSGDAAQWGINTQRGINLALDEINANGGVEGRKIRVIFEDTKALPKEGVNAYHKLTSINNVPAIIDDSVSGVTLAMAPLAERDNVVILATGATAPKISEAGDYIFRIWNSDAYEGEFSAKYAYNSLGIRNVAILYVNNEYGRGLERVFKNEFQNLGGKLGESESFSQNSNDMRSQISKIISNNPDAIYIVGYPKETPIILRQTKELGFHGKLLGTVAMFDNQLLEVAGEAAEGLVFPFPLDPTGDEVDSFRAKFIAKYGENPGIVADVGYDAINMIVAAMKLSGETTGSGIKNGLYSLKDFKGASGLMNFDKKGDVRKPMGIKKVENSAFVWSE